MNATKGMAGPKLWVPGDLNGFFGLCTNSITNTLVAVSLMQFVIGFPKEILFGRIVPGLVLSLAVGNIYFAYMAYRLAKKEGRDDVTAVPYGISVPHYFLVTFAIMLPLKMGGADFDTLWSVGVAWCFVHAIVATIGAFIGPTMQKLTPRAAMLGTLAGVAITYIAMGAAFNAWNVAWLSMVSFGIIFVGWLANVQFPGKIPAGLVAVILGIIFGWASGYMKADALVEAVANATIAIPIPQLRILFAGLPQVTPYLVTAIPLAIYLFLESLNNVESALAGGDTYDTREAMLAAAGGTLVASLFGSPFPTLIYIGHPGWKSVGSRVGYSWLTGVTMLLLGVLGLLGILSAVIPVVAILPILVYIGILITSQAFNASPKRHAPAVAIAIVPWIADYVTTQVNNTLGAAGTSAAALGADTLASNGVAYGGMTVLGAGSILVAMILAAIAAYVIDRNWKGAIGYSLFGAACAWVGFIHSTKLRFFPSGPFNFNDPSFNATWGPVIGYLAIALLLTGMMYYTRNEPVTQLEAVPAGE
jgi:AGZA family xanthine/uracil permease-like MFS transporter